MESDSHSTRLRYGAALAVGAGVLAVYVFTLAPTATLWDAGEFIAAAKIMGIPHPPGTPLFILLNNVWAKLIAFGEFAWRTNLMSAMFSAAGAALWFLLIHRALAQESVQVRFGGALAGAVLSAFAFTVWQNSNETEAYMVATFTIAAVSWLCVLWRNRRGTPGAAHVLLLIMYLLAVSVGNHLLALLAGPAVIVYLFHVMRTAPLEDDAERQTEWVQWLVVTSVWGMLVAISVGDTGFLMAVGLAFVGAALFDITRRAWAQWLVVATVWGLLVAVSVGSRALLIAVSITFVGALVWSISRRAGAFAAAVLVLTAVGISTYAVLYIRAGLSPMVNEADPSTLDALISVIQRKQYPVRKPWDNPIFPTGPGNPMRSLELVVLQVQNYIQYFDWQWSRVLARMNPLPNFARLPVTLVFTSLGIYGLATLRRTDRSLSWLLVVLWLTTGLGLVAYMNFKPGFAIAWDRYPDFSMHEVRERDYFFVVSFVCWGLFAGVGLAGLVRAMHRRLGQGAIALYGLVLIPLVLNFSVASRRHTPDAELARDFAYNMLQSVEPYGILFTYGDNDTFPLWYLQEVEGVRQDVVVVNLSLVNIPWYIRQLRDNPVRPFEPSGAPAKYAELAPASPPGPLHTLRDADIDSLVPQILRRPSEFAAGPIIRLFPAGSRFLIKDLMTLILIRENWNKRPVTWGIPAGRDTWLGFDAYLVQQGLVVRLARDTVRLGLGLAPGLSGAALDIERTRWLADSVYRYADLFEADTLFLEPTAAGIATNLSNPLYNLAAAGGVQGDRERSERDLRRASHLAPNQPLAGAIRSTWDLKPGASAGDSTVPANR